MLSESHLRTLATRVRLAIEQHLRANPDINLSTNFINPTRGSFPLDSCKATSHILGYVFVRLEEANPAGLQYVWGQRGLETHGWLQSGEFIIDLTADQFDDENRSVVVVQRDLSPWHDSFKPHYWTPFSLRSTSPLVITAEAVMALLGSDS